MVIWFTRLNQIYYFIQTHFSLKVIRDNKTKYVTILNLTTYKFTRRILSMIREVNLLNNGNADILVPKSEVLSAEVTLRSLISVASTFF